MVRRQPLIDSEINGQKVSMLADTGSDRSVILRAAAVRLKLHQMELRGMMSYGIGGSSAPTYADVDELKLGGFDARNFSMMVVGEGPISDDGPAGLIGNDLWDRTDDEIDLGRAVIRMIRPSGCVGDQLIGYWGASYSVADLLIPPTNRTAYLVTVMLDGIPLRAELDTGSMHSFVTRQGFYKLHRPWPLAPSDGKDNAVRGLGRKAVASTLVKFKMFEFDTEKIANPQISVADLFGDNQAVQLGSRTKQDVLTFPDMILGADFFLSHRVMISNSQRKVYIAYTGGNVF